MKRHRNINIHQHKIEACFGDEQYTQFNKDNNQVEIWKL